MLDALRQEDTALYLDFNFTDLVKNRWGYQRGSDSVTSVRQNLALQFSYGINTLKALTTESYTLLRLPKIQKAAAKTAAAAATYDFTGIAAVTLGNTLYSLSLIHIFKGPCNTMNRAASSAFTAAKR